MLCYAVLHRSYTLLCCSALSLDISRFRAHRPIRSQDVYSKRLSLIFIQCCLMGSHGVSWFRTPCECEFSSHVGSTETNVNAEGADDGTQGRGSDPADPHADPHEEGGGGGGSRQARK
eukprot:7463357-Pyramimonas_sp.AAC.1